MANILTDPPFAANPPVKVNVPAKTLGLVLLILGVIGIVLGLIGLLGTFGACTIAGISIGGCGLPILWLLGALIGLIGVCVGTLGAYQMYQLNRDGKRLVIYGLALGFIGAIVTLIGNITFYSGLSGVLGVGYGGAIFGLIIDAIVYGIVWYLVVISRWPGDAPLVATGSTGGYGNPPGGYGSPPPPPPPSA